VFSSLVKLCLYFFVVFLIITFCFLPSYFSQITKKGFLNVLSVNIISGPNEGLELGLSFLFSEMFLSQNQMSTIFFFFLFPL
jgi:hypothetical protein